jgi:hypothetical protein
MSQATAAPSGYSGRMPPIYTDPPPSRGWFTPVLLGWVALLAMVAVATWLGFESVDRLVAQHPSGAEALR